MYKDPIAVVEGKAFTKGYHVNWEHGEAFFLWEAEANQFARALSSIGSISVYRKGAILNTYHNGKLKRKVR